MDPSSTTASIDFNSVENTDSLHSKEVDDLSSLTPNGRTFHRFDFPNGETVVSWLVPTEGQTEKGSLVTVNVRSWYQSKSLVQSESIAEAFVQARAGMTLLDKAESVADRLFVWRKLGADEAVWRSLGLDYWQKEFVSTHGSNTAVKVTLLESLDKVQTVGLSSILATTEKEFSKRAAASDWERPGSSSLSGAGGSSKRPVESDSGDQDEESRHSVSQKKPALKGQYKITPPSEGPLTHAQATGAIDILIGEMSPRWRTHSLAASRQKYLKVRTDVLVTSLLALMTPAVDEAGPSETPFGMTHRWLKTIYGGLELRSGSDLSGCDTMEEGLKAVAAVIVKMVEERKGMKRPAKDVLEYVKERLDDLKLPDEM